MVCISFLFIRQREFTNEDNDFWLSVSNNEMRTKTGEQKPTFRAILVCGHKKKHFELNRIFIKLSMYIYSKLAYPFTVNSNLFLEYVRVKLLYSIRFVCTHWSSFSHSICFVFVCLFSCSNCPVGTFSLDRCTCACACVCVVICPMNISTAK